MILLPLYYQQLRHESVIDTGLLLGPQGIGMALVMPFVGRLVDRIGGGVLAFGGVAVTVLAGIPLGLIGAHTSIAWLSVVMLVRGIGIGFAFMPAFVAAFAALERHQLPDAAPQLNVLMRVGGSIGTAVLAVVLERALLSAGHHPSPAAVAGAFGTAFWWSLGISAAALGPCVGAHPLRASGKARPERRVGGRRASRRAAPGRGRGVSATVARDADLAQPSGPDVGGHRAAVASFAGTFKAAMAAVRRLRGRDTHRPGELSYAQYGLLFGLADGGERSASELAGLADVAPATATQMLDSLVAGGFVERSRSERDRRLVLVSLTAREAS